MNEDVRLPLGCRAKEYAVAALAARDQAETTWVQDDNGQVVAAIVPRDVALRGDWRKLDAIPPSGYDAGVEERSSDFGLAILPTSVEAGGTGPRCRFGGGFIDSTGAHHTHALNEEHGWCPGCTLREEMFEAVRRYAEAVRSAGTTVGS